MMCACATRASCGNPEDCDPAAEAVTLDVKVAPAA